VGATVDKRGIFVTFEGIEGSGKTTQAVMFCEYVRSQGIDAVHTRDPGGTTVGENIRKLLLAPSDCVPAPITELLLFLAARAQQVSEVILPGLEAGRWIISDRFYDSTLAYQGYGRAISIEAIRSMNAIATGGLEPDMTILLDLDIQTGIRRATAQNDEFSELSAGDRMETETEEFHARVREGYLELASQEPGRIKVVPATGSAGEIQDSIRLLAKPFLEGIR
jgi:dTMP kinase